MKITWYRVIRDILEMLMLSVENYFIHNLWILGMRISRIGCWIRGSHLEFTPNCDHRSYCVQCGAPYDPNKKWIREEDYLA